MFRNDGRIQIAFDLRAVPIVGIALYDIFDGEFFAFELRARLRAVLPERVIDVQLITVVSYGGREPNDGIEHDGGLFPDRNQHSVD